MEWSHFQVAGLQLVRDLGPGPDPDWAQGSPGPAHLWEGYAQARWRCAGRVGP